MAGSIRLSSSLSACSAPISQRKAVSFCVAHGAQPAPYKTTDFPHKDEFRQQSLRRVFDVSEVRADRIRARLSSISSYHTAVSHQEDELEQQDNEDIQTRLPELSSSHGRLTSSSLVSFPPLPDSLEEKSLIARILEALGLGELGEERDSASVIEERPLIARILEVLGLDDLDEERDLAPLLVLRDALLGLNSLFNPNYCVGKSDIEESDLLAMDHVRPLNRAALIGGVIAVVAVSVMAKILCAPLSVLVLATLSTALLIKLIRDCIFLLREENIHFHFPWE